MAFAITWVELLWEALKAEGVELSEFPKEK